MAYNGGGLEDPQNWPFSVRYTASPYRKSKFPVDSSTPTNQSSSPAQWPTTAPTMYHPPHNNNNNSHQNQHHHHRPNGGAPSTPSAAHHNGMTANGNGAIHLLPYPFGYMNATGTPSHPPISNNPGDANHQPHAQHQSSALHQNQNNHFFHHHQHQHPHHQVAPGNSTKREYQFNNHPSTTAPLTYYAALQGGTNNPDYHHYGLPPPIPTPAIPPSDCQFFIRYPRNFRQNPTAYLNSDPNQQNQVEAILDEGYIEDLKQPYRHQPKSVCLGQGGLENNNSDYDPYSYVYDSKIHEDMSVTSVQVCCPVGNPSLPHSSESSNPPTLLHQSNPSNHITMTTANNSPISNSSRNPPSENEYEEIRDVARYMNSNPTTGPLHFKSFSSTDDILAEVVQVQQRHDRVLDQLNLEVENLLLNSSHDIERGGTGTAFSSSVTNNNPSDSLNGVGGGKGGGGIFSSGGHLDKISSLSLNGIYTECYCDEIPSLPQFGGTLNIFRGGSSNGSACVTNAFTKDQSAGPTGPACCCSNPPSANDSSEFLNKSLRSHSLTFNNPFFPHHPPPPLSASKSIHSHAINGTSEFDLSNSSALIGSNNTFGRKKKIHRHTIQFQPNPPHIQLNENDPKNQLNNHTPPSSLPDSKNCKNRHHRSYSLIPHWKIREHLRRLPFLRQQNKVKKTEATPGLPSSLSTIPISSSAQDFSSNCKKMSSGGLTSSKTMVSTKIRSSSMDELRATGPEEHWYSADSDTEPDSLTAIPESSNGLPNGKSPSSLGNIINTAVSSSTTSVSLSAGPENGSKFDIGSGIPEAPKAPKFRRGTGLKDKWRESWGSTKGGKAISDEDNRLLRWFSLRKNETNFEPPGVRQSSATLPLLTEEELNGTEGYWPRRTVQPPRLPELSPEQLARLTPEQLTRRQIVAAIVYSENNYLSSLQRLVNMMLQLRQSHPAILSHTKISSVFHRVPEIFQCHSLFRIALAECVRRWDADEKIGDVFVASFSKSLVLDVYSEFINNFGLAMETAKVEARRKSAFADFLKVQLHLHSDRLSLFGLMVKPVQRFPQFILLLQDLLKHTPKDHHDRMSLQLALTQLESLAAMLNERKRESEQYQEFVKQIKSIGGKFGLLRSIADDPNRILLRQDIVTQLDFDNGGAAVPKSKSRKLLLLNDMLICVALSQGTSPDQQSAQSNHQSNGGDSNTNGIHGSKAEKSVFKWSKHLRDIEVEDISISPTMSRFVQSGGEKRSSLKATGSANQASLPDEVELLEEMQSLMHDYEVFSRMLVLSSSLKTQYDGFTQSSIKETMLEIQHQIRRRDEQISYFDSSFLTLIMGTEKLVFQMQNPSARNEWIEELRLAQLALDDNNSPGWDIPESPYTQHKIPLFVRSLPIKSPNVATVKSGCYFTHTFVGPTGRYKIYDLLYICTSDGFSSHIKAYRSQQNTLKEISSFDFDLVEEKVNELLFVAGHVWLATESRKIMVFDPSNPTKGNVGSYILNDSVLKLTYFEGCVYAGLADGTLAVFTELETVSTLKPFVIIKLGEHKIRAVFGSRDHIYAACGNAVVSIDAKTHTIEKNVVLNHHGGPIAHMACSGVGLWIVTENSGTVCLYHLESLQHLQDVSIAPSVFRTVRDSYGRQKGCYVTCLAAHKGWLWIGTNLGVILTIPLPRLEGVPIINTGKANVSYHGYSGPVTFLMPLMKPSSALSSGISASRRTKVEVIPPTPSSESSPKPPPSLPEENLDTVSKSSSKSGSINFETIENQSDLKEVHSSNSSSSLGQNEIKDADSSKAVSNNSLTRTPSDTGSVGETTSPNKALVVLRKKNSKDSVFSRNCKTLPRGGPIPANLRFSIDSDVYGLYGNLINVRGLEDEGRFVDPLYDALRRSDPELGTLDAKISTLDRRLKMRMSRPRSLDLSNWSVDSKISASSDESVGLRSSPATDPTGMPDSTNSDSPVPTEATNTSVLHSGTVKKTLTTRPNKKTKGSADRTVIVVVGGRGYVNIRNNAAPDHFAPITETTSDTRQNAHLIVWQMKT